MRCDLPDNPYVKQFQDLLKSCDLAQHIDKPTHTAGHTLDLVISRKNLSQCSVTSVSVLDKAEISDRYPVTCHVTTNWTNTRRKCHMLRSLRKVNCTALAKDLAAELAHLEEAGEPDDLTLLFDTTARQVLDKYGPVCKIIIKGETRKPWCNTELHEARQR